LGDNLLNTQKTHTKLAIYSILLLFINLTTISPAFSAIVSSNELLSNHQATEKRVELASLFDRTEVKKELIKRGVDPALAKMRINSMTDLEVSKLTSDLEDLPAGQGVLGLIALVLIILLLTEILGYTDVSDKV
jgi:hypothetical protein